MDPWEDLPELNFEHHIRGHGFLKYGGIELWVPAFEISRPKYGAGSGWEIMAHPDAKFKEINSLVRRNEKPIRLEGESDRGQPVRVPEFRVRTFTHYRVEGVGFEIEVGPDSLPSVPNGQNAYVTFSFNPVAEPEVLFPFRSAKGELKKDRPSKSRDPLTVPTQFGEAEFARKYQWEDAMVAEEKVPVRVPRPLLQVEVEKGDRTSKPFDIIRVFEDELQSFSRLLSFLSRKDVAWVHAKVFSSWDESEAEYPKESELWKAGGAWERTSSLDRLVVPGRMAREDLGDLFASFESLEFRDAVFHAIGFLIGAVSERYVEVQLMNAFTALEAIVSGFCRSENLEFIVAPRFHNDLRKHIKKQIHDFVKEDNRVPSGYAEPIRDALTRKMAGSHTRRRSFADRVVDLVEGSGTPWRGLWPEGTNLRAAISDAYARRSKLVHGGKRSDAVPAIVDVFRIHALTERAIFRLIGGDPNWVAPTAYQHCGRLPSFDQ